MRLVMSEQGNAQNSKNIELRKCYTMDSFIA